MGLLFTVLDHQILPFAVIYCPVSIHYISNINSLAPGKFVWDSRYVIFNQILVIDGWGISCEIALVWMSLDFINDQSTLVQVMAWCRQATNHYLSQCWSWFLSPYGVTRPEWVNHIQDYESRPCYTMMLFWLLEVMALTSSVQGCPISLSWGGGLARFWTW